MNAIVDTHGKLLGEPEAVDSRALVPAANPLDIAPEAFRGALARRGENRKALMEWVRSSLVKGTDFGHIHVVSKSKCPDGNQCQNSSHWSKACLFKPGAEKIAGMLGVTPTFPTLPEYEKAALAGVELKQIILRCHMVNAEGRIVADGIGARSLEQDYGDINKALKMCAKSAHIDATLRMAGLSEVFTQDLDQMKLDGKLDNEPSRTAAPGVVTDSGLVPAGKYKGKKWVEVSHDYLAWAATADRCPAVLREACKAEIDRRTAEAMGGIDEGDKIPFESEAGVRG